MKSGVEQELKLFELLRRLEECYSDRLLINMALEQNHFAMVIQVCAFTMHIIKSLYYSRLPWMTALAPSGRAISL